MRLFVTIVGPLVGYRCEETVFRICHSGITFCEFFKVPPVSASMEEEATVLSVLHCVKIGLFGVGFPWNNHAYSL